ncbi:inner membrane protein YpjD [Marinimicrobium sp. ABcell2]|uniref:cytochrome C assembly family protein n=1 Tax=Marinimicrobium sp. ABcell2 TaxID=3069751 RepID=UPI0027B75037|nr:cytochrome c biogenesis protein CcsA [Marinimicrobium sp. ABcell2]MDQ2075684.1 cytochrome c biogenesis protein CcsA [Marinimicrobium sp. ABcell2]
MISFAANIIALLLYVGASGYLVYCLKQKAPANRHWLLSWVAAALVAHGVGIYALTISEHGVRVGFFPVSTLIFWVINAIVLVSCLRKPLHNLFILLLPLTVLGICASLLGRESGTHVDLRLGLASHALLSILAYSLLTIATLQALLLAWQNHQLRHKHPSGSVRLLPPLQTMEALLFEVLWAGVVLLTLSILSGFVFLDDMFAQHLVHKTAFSLAAWLIYVVLLWGRHRQGWRGYTAIRWTLVGFALLMLAYFGSKLVLELILGRS